MSPSSPNLNSKQQIAAMQLAIGATGDDAAAAAGVNPRTIDRWRTDESFNQAIATIRREIHGEAIGAIVDSLTTAVTALRAIAGDSAAPASSRVSAAKTLLDSAYRSIEGAELEKRLIEVEMAVAEYRQS